MNTYYCGSIRKEQQMSDATSASPGIKDKRAAYRAYSAGYITEDEAREVLGDDWERVAQLLTIEQHVAAVDRDTEDAEQYRA
jgi:hypothetical protein